MGEGGKCGGGGAGRAGRALGRIDVGICYTRGAGSRRSCGWWERRGRWRGGGGINESYVMDGQKDNDVISIS